MGPPLRHMIYPESKQNLNISMGVPLGTDLPSWLPQQALLNAVRDWHSDGDGGVVLL